MPSSSPQKKKPVIALFNYGGGMRGLLPAHFMQKIEETTGLHMSDMVDVFMGPSTGSILNAALNIPNPHDPTKPKFKARHMVRFYEREGIHIFPRDSFRSFRSMIHDFNNRTMRIEQLGNLLKHGHYEHASLGRSLRALYGRHKLSDSLKSLIIPVYNIEGEALRPTQEQGETPNSPVHSVNTFLNEGGHALWLKNMKFEGAQHTLPPQQVDIFDAVMASTAAPTYFPCYSFDMHDAENSKKQSIAGIDGSIFDNPCISYMGALRRHIPADRDLIIIVLGTGYFNRSYKKEDWNRFGSLGVVDPSNDMPLINIFFYASETALLDSFRHEVGDNLYVFNKSLVSGPYMRDYPNTDIDDASPENLRRLKNFFEITLEENRKSFNEICEILVKNYDESRKSVKSSEKESKTTSIGDKIKSKLLGK
ncbi:MAG TPA: patatin-like phospholipase family protein [Alphaproteobacteria bacterium]|nr:patatin-like phospholipase family protein [Alphaproteobacteria bacterium]HOO50538.1 patatin-like phospholipase family protein [Alphaproteobacteria bacterium]